MQIRSCRSKFFKCYGKWHCLLPTFRSFRSKVFEIVSFKSLDVKGNNSQVQSDWEFFKEFFFWGGIFCHAIFCFVFYCFLTKISGEGKASEGGTNCLRGCLMRKKARLATEHPQSCYAQQLMAVESIARCPQYLQHVQFNEYSSSIQ